MKQMLLQDEIDRVEVVVYVDFDGTLYFEVPLPRKIERQEGWTDELFEYKCQEHERQYFDGVQARTEALGLKRLRDLIFTSGKGRAQAFPFKEEFTKMVGSLSLGAFRPGVQQLGVVIQNCYIRQVEAWQNN